MTTLSPHTTLRVSREWSTLGEKNATRRTARAHAFVRMSREVLAALPNNPKGDPLGVARVAGILAAKRNSRTRFRSAIPCRFHMSKWR